MRPLALTIILLTCMNWSIPGLGQETSSKARVVAIGPVEIVHQGFEFTEGPAWDPATKSIYFTDIPNATIHRVDTKNQLSAFTTDSKHANGLLIAADGRLLACQMDGQVVAFDRDSGKETVLANQFEGRRFNAPNDLVLDKHGGIYFTDPLFRAPEPLPQTVQAVYYIGVDGTITRVTDDLAAPNGIGLSPDGDRLYVAPSHQSEMLVYDVDGPGELSGGRTFCQLTQPKGKSNTGGDGLVLDVVGNVYFTTHQGVQIFSPAGDSIGLVSFPQQPANVTFTGTDRKMMVVTARTSVYRVAMPIAGLPPN